MSPIEHHIVPVRDEKEQALSMNCGCEPLRDIEQPSVVVHQSWDRREVLEELELRLRKKITKSAWLRDFFKGRKDMDNHEPH